MGKFFMRLFSFLVEKPKPVRSTPTEPLQAAYQDALLLLDAIYAGEPWSRRAFANRISQPRWAAAASLLRSAEILDSKGRQMVTLRMDQMAAEVMVREAVRRERIKRQTKTYVSPW